MRTILITLLLCLMPAGLFAADDTTSSKKTYDHFRVIYERNVFSKDRLPPRSPNRSVRKAQTQVLAIYVLRGTSAEAGRAHRFALVEEQVSEQSQTVKVGSEILGGVIKGIYMNYVLFEQDGVIRKINIGQEFGQTSTTVYAEESEKAVEATDGAEQKESEPKESTDKQESTTNEEDMLKKMLERRQRELGT